MRLDSIAPIEPSSAGYTACEFKDSPLGQIPQEWDVKTIAETAAPITNSFTDGDWIEAPHIRQQGIRLVQTGNIGVGEFLDKAEDRKFISQESFAALGCKALQTGDVLICRLADPVGRACVVPDYIGDAITAVDVTIYRPNPKLLRSRFAMWQMNSLSALNRCDVLAGGTTRKRISRLNLGRLPLAVPKIEEQITIEVVLDTVDAAISKTEAVIAKLKQVRAGLLHDLLTRGLDENGQLRDPIAHPEQFQGSPLGRIPREWEVRPLERCVSSEITYGIVQAGPHIDEGVPYIRTGDMGNDRLVVDQMLRTSPEIAAQYRRSRVHAGEIVCAIRATVGKVLVVPAELDGANLTQGTARIAPKDEINSTFLLWAIRSDKTQRQIALQIKGTTFSEITLANLRRIDVPIPSQREEQEQIATVIQGLETHLLSETSELSKLQYLKSGLMNDLLTGRVRVPEGIAVTG